MKSILIIDNQLFNLRFQIGLKQFNLITRKKVKILNNSAAVIVKVKTHPKMDGRATKSSDQ